MIYDAFFKDIISRETFEPWIHLELAKTIDGDIREKFEMARFNEHTYSIAFMLQHFRNQEEIKDLLSQVCRNTHFK